MKRSFKLLLCIIAIVALMVGCELPVGTPDTHGHEFVDANSDGICDTCNTDGTATHGHAFVDANGDNVCDTCNNDGAATHGHAFVDSNNDNVCDTCAAAAHVHTYASEWSYNATKHWHAANCGHSSLKKDEASHSLNALGVCTVCGAEVSEPDVSTVDKAIELAAAQKALVKAGTVANMYYEYRDGYLFVKNVETGVEYYYSANGDGILAVIKTTEATYPNATASVDNLKGAEIVVAYNWTFYGADDLVATLWDMANGDDNVLSGGVISSIDDGVYSFTLALDNWGPVVITVEFTLDEDAYFFDSVKVSAVKYYDYEEDDDGNYIISDDSGTFEYDVIEFAQADAIDNSNPFTPEMFTVTDFKFFDEYYDEITEVEAELGYNTVIYLDALAPDTLTFEFIDVVFGANDYIEAYFNSTYGTLTISTLYDAAIGETYTLEVTVGNLTKTIDVKVVAPSVDEVVAGTADMGMDEWGYEVVVKDFDETDEIEMFVGQNVILGVITHKGENGATVIAINENGERTVLTAISTDNYNPYYYDEDLEANRIVFAYDLSVLAPGKYSIGCISVDNIDVMTTVDVEVKAPYTLAEAFGFIYNFDIITESGMMQTFLDRITFKFIVDEQGSYPAYGYIRGEVEITTAVVIVDWMGEYIDPDLTETQRYYFAYENGSFTFTHMMTYMTVDIGYLLKFNEYNELQLGVADFITGTTTEAPAAPEAPTAANQIVGDWTYATEDTYMLGDFVATYTYQFTFNEDGSVDVLYDGYIDGMGWHNADPVTYTCYYSIATTAEGGAYAIMLISGGLCEVPGFDVAAAAASLNEALDTLTITIDGVAQSLTKA